MTDDEARALKAILVEIQKKNYYVEPYVGERDSKGFDTVVKVGVLPIAVNPTVRSFGFYGPNKQYMFFGPSEQDPPNWRERRAVKRFFRLVRLHDLQFNDWRRYVTTPLRLSDPEAPEAPQDSLEAEASF